MPARSGPLCAPGSPEPVEAQQKGLQSKHFARVEGQVGREPIYEGYRLGDVAYREGTAHGSVPVSPSKGSKPHAELVGVLAALFAAVAFLELAGKSLGLALSGPSLHRVRRHQLRHL